jgi:predicted nucleic acid-binding protein
VIHLDTSFLIHALVRSSVADKRLRKWLRADDDLAISSIAWTEFLCGPVASSDLDAVAAMFTEIVPYTTNDAEMAARLFNVGGRRRGTLADCMIAAVAIRAGASLATTNPRDFERFVPEALTIVAG